MDKYEKIVFEFLEIPYCNLENVREDIKLEIVLGFTQMYLEYPLFKNIICSIGNVEDLKHHLNMLEFSLKENFNNGNCIYDEQTYRHKDSLFSFFSYSRFKEYQKLPITIKDYGYFAFVMYDRVKTTNHGLLGVYHEFGHLLDRFLNISNSKEFTSLIKEHNIKEEIDEYATTSEFETFACAFSYYCLYKFQKDLAKAIKYNPLIEQIGLLTDEKYQHYERIIKMLNLEENYNFKKYYDFQRKYKLKTLSKNS